MKYLLILFLIASCGKHEMPEAKDLGDSDGDQLLNHEEPNGIDKYIANINSFEDIQSEISFKQGINTLETYSFKLENRFDITKATKDLLVKKTSSLPVDDYFSEFSSLHITSNKKDVIINEEQTAVTMTFNKNFESSRLTILTRNGRIDLGYCRPIMHFNVLKEDLKSLISGHSLFFISKENKELEKKIKEKTYRVFIHENNRSQVYYVSKELSFEMFLNHMNIQEYKTLEKTDFLSKSIKASLPEWWVKEINHQNKVVIYSDLRTIADHYFQTFELQYMTLKRLRGVSDKKSVTLMKDKNSKILLKIRATRREIKLALYPYLVSNEEAPVTPKHCKRRFMKVSKIIKTNVFESDIRQSLKFYTNRKDVLTDYKVYESEDENGKFWEIEFSEDIKDLSIAMLDAPKEEYLPFKWIVSGCLEAANFPPALRSPENEFILSIEAFVEKI